MSRYSIMQAKSNSWRYAGVARATVDDGDDADGADGADDDAGDGDDGGAELSRLQVRLFLFCLLFTPLSSFYLCLRALHPQTNRSSASGSTSRVRCATCSTARETSGKATTLSTISVRSCSGSRRRDAIFFGGRRVWCEGSRTEFARPRRRSVVGWSSSVGRRSSSSVVVVGRRWSIGCRLTRSHPSDECVRVVRAPTPSPTRS